MSGKGREGRELKVKLELKLLADVALVGYPSVGKSSFINKVSAAKSKVANYHFTTLAPKLGLVRLEEEKEEEEEEEEEGRKQEEAKIMEEKQ